MIIAVEKEKLQTLLKGVGLADLTDQVIDEMEVPMSTIDDFTRSIVENSERWFPNAYVTPEQAILTNVLGIAGEGGEIADEYKKFVRGSLTWDELVDKLNEESIDLMHYLFQLWHFNKTNVANEYGKKTIVNEHRFGTKEV